MNDEVPDKFYPLQGESQIARPKPGDRSAYENDPVLLERYDKFGEDFAGQVQAHEDYLFNEAMRNRFSRGLRLLLCRWFVPRQEFDALKRRLDKLEGDGDD